MLPSAAGVGRNRVRSWRRAQMRRARLPYRWLKAILSTVPNFPLTTSYVIEERSRTRHHVQAYTMQYVRSHRSVRIAEAECCIVRYDYDVHTAVVVSGSLSKLPVFDPLHRGHLYCTRTRFARCRDDPSSWLPLVKVIHLVVAAHV
jgi:hypothetical protein